MTLTLCLAVAASLALPTDPPMQVTGHVVRPATVPATPERTAALAIADGYKVTVFARDLGKPRMIAVADDGAIYITRRGKTAEGGGDILLLRTALSGETAGSPVTAAKLDHAHGIGLRPGTREVFIATINELYRYTRADDGTFTDKTLIASNLPDAGQHPNRTIDFKPGDADTLFMSIGSTCNSCMEGNPLAATMATLALPQPGAEVKATDPNKPTVFAKGLRNTIGFAWHPATGQLWGMDHGIDWLGDDEQGEELNQLNHDADYGWPVAFERNRINHTLPDKLPGGVTKEQFAAKCIPSVLLTTAHAAPMQMAFAPGTGAMGAEAKNDAFLALHGSWNRKPPSGYSVVRIRFDAAGQPTAFEPFITGWLTESEGKPAAFGRPCGLAFAKDGALLFTDDENGVLYRVTKY